MALAPPSIRSSRAASIVVGAALGDVLGARYDGIPIRWPQAFIRPGRPARTSDVSEVGPTGLVETSRRGRLRRGARQWNDDTDLVLATLLAARESGHRAGRPMEPATFRAIEEQVGQWRQRRSTAGRLGAARAWRARYGPAVSAVPSGSDHHAGPYHHAGAEHDGAVELGGDGSPPPPYSSVPYSSVPYVSEPNLPVPYSSVSSGAARLAAEAGNVEGAGERDDGRAANDALVCAAAVAILCGDRAEDALEAAAAAAEQTGASARVGEAAGAMALLFQQALSGRRPDPTALRRFAFGPAVSEALNRPRRPALGPRRGWASSTLSGVLWVVDRTLERYEPDQWLRRGLTLAVAQGGETETVAALAGGLLGGLEPHGVNLPQWSDDVHGGEWTGQRWTLADLATLTSERYD